MNIKCWKVGTDMFSRIFNNPEDAKNYALNYCASVIMPDEYGEPTKEDIAYWKEQERRIENINFSAMNVNHYDWVSRGLKIECLVLVFDENCRIGCDPSKGKCTLDF